jgi:SsrA-binding protein
MAKRKQGSQKVADTIRVVETNKKARRDYEILDSIEAGIELRGSEVKSVRAGGMSLRESYVSFKNQECFLVGCHISPYRFSRVDAHEPLRERRLLLHAREIARLGAQVRAKGLTVVPLKAFFNPQGRLKLEIGLARGKKLYDKREDIKKREDMREMERALKRPRR